MIITHLKINIPTVKNQEQSTNNVLSFLSLCVIIIGHRSIQVNV